MRQLFILFFVITVNLMSAQSPWVLAEKATYLQFNYSNISNYNEIFSDPDYLTERVLSDNTLQIYLEYGVSNKTTLLLAAPFKIISAGRLSNQNNSNPVTSSGELNHFGNIIFGVKHNISSKKWLITSQFNLEANTSVYDNLTGARTGIPAWTLSPTLNAGRGFNKTYMQFFGGFDLRTNDYSSNLKLGGEFGYKVLNTIWIIVYIDMVQSLKNGNVQLPINNLATALYVNNQSYGGYGAKLIAELTKNTGLTSSFGGAFFGNNVAKKVAINLGIFQRF